MAKNDNVQDLLIDVANAIREKKGTTDLINPQNFSTEIASIETGSNGDYDVQSIPLEDGTQKIVVTTVAGAEKPKDMLQARVDGDNSCEYLFYKYRGTSLDVSRLDTKNVTTMKSMFDGCFYLTSLDVSNFNTSQVTNMYYMFNGCNNLTSLDLRSFDVSLVEDMEYMFQGCQKIVSIDLTGWNTSEVLSMKTLFRNCTNLKTVIGTIDVSNADCFNIIFGCKSITDLKLINIKTSIQLGSGTSYGVNLSDDTIINTFKELHDLTDEETQTLTLSTTTKTKIDAIYVKLIDVTDEMIANDPYITSKKPCIVCESTDAGAMTLREYGISKNWNIA